MWFIDRLSELVTEYNNTVQRTIKMLNQKHILTLPLSVFSYYTTKSDIGAKRADT